jgi:hypothetical protein
MTLDLAFLRAADAFAPPPEPDVEPEPSADERLAALGALRWYDDPVGWATHCIDWRPGEGLTGYQRDVLRALVPGSGQAGARVSFRGPHGIGKTGIQAIGVLWFATTRDAAAVDWKCVTTAGAWRQLTEYLWPEIHKWTGRLRWDVLQRDPWRRGHELLDLSLKLRHGRAFAAASDQPALIEGAHADSVMYVYDESKAISSDTFDASEGAFSGAGAAPEGQPARRGPTGRPLPEAVAIAGSTPGAPAGRFYDIHTRKPGLEDWTVRHVTLAEAIAAGRVSQTWAEQRGRQWGLTSGLYANRVLGEFHADDEQSVIPLAWVEAAVARWRMWHEMGCPDRPGRRIFGVDVADSGGERTVIAVLQGDVVLELRRPPVGQDTMQTAGQVVAALHHPQSRSIIDAIGVGAGVTARVREQGLPAVGFVASSSAGGWLDRSGELQAKNARAAAWWTLRELLDPTFGATLALPDDDELLGDLTAPRWRIQSGGKLLIEPKDDVRARLGRSPDAGDAVVMACWAASRATGADFDGADEQWRDETLAAHEIDFMTVPL